MMIHKYLMITLSFRIETNCAILGAIVIVFVL